MNGHVAATARPLPPVEPTSLDDVTAALSALRDWAGEPSYARIARRVGSARRARGVPADEATPGKVTVYDCFRTGRRRFDAALLTDVALALGAPPEEAKAWAAAARIAVRPDARLAAVRVEAGLSSREGGLDGRDDEVAAAIAALRDAPYVVVEGAPGAGKSALAVEVAHLLSAEAATVVLSVDLQGHSAERRVDPDLAVDAVIRALCPAKRAVPTGAARRGAYDAALAERRVVLVLDDARDAEQVVPLLPGPSALPRGSRAVVTTRSAEVASSLGAPRVVVDELDDDACVRVLTRMTGRPGTLDDQERAAARQLCRDAGRSPLGLALAAARITARPTWSLADHVESGTDAQDLGRDERLHAVMDASYHDLDADLQRAFRLLSVLPVPDVVVERVAAVLARSTDEAAVIVDDLSARHLLRPTGPGRWRQHDLVRAYGAVRAREHERPSDLREALRRLLLHHEAMVGGCVRALYPGLPRLLERLTPQEPIVLDAPSANAWLRDELVAVQRTAQWAAGAGEGWHTRGVAIALSTPLWDRDVRAAVALLRVARNDAIKQGSDDLAVLERRLGESLLVAHCADEAVGPLEHALVLYRRTGDELDVARVGSALASAACHQGRFDDARARYEGVIAIARRHPETDLHTVSLSNLGYTHQLLGDHERALACYDEALAVAVAGGWTRGDVHALANRGDALAELGRWPEAYAAATRAQQLAVERGDDHTAALVAVVLHRCAAYAGDHDEALRLADVALHGAVTVGDPLLEAQARLHLGAYHLACGRTDAARTYVQRARDIAVETHARVEVQRADELLSRLP